MKAVFKILLVLSPLIIIPACDQLNSLDKLKEFRPRFRFGDPVAVTDGFYSGCHGRVTDYRIWGSDIVYKVNMYCDSSDGKFGHSNDGEYKESDLVEDAVNH
jgi:hypothetical protein